MSTNTRELIIEQMITVLSGVPKIQGVFRNRGDLPPRDKTPGITFLDGPIERKTPVDGFNITQMPPAVFTMRPEVVLALTPRDTTIDNNTLDGVYNPVGPEMASFEAAIVAAILTDDMLVALCTDDGSVIYDGFESDMRNGSTMGATGATMIFKFAISYVLDPSDLI